MVMDGSPGIVRIDVSGIAKRGERRGSGREKKAPLPSCNVEYNKETLPPHCKEAQGVIK
jgi:hypothetical protein